MNNGEEGEGIYNDIQSKKKNLIPYQYQAPLVSFEWGDGPNSAGVGLTTEEYETIQHH